LNGGEITSCAGSVNYSLPASLPHGSLNTNALPTVTYTATDTNFTGVASFNYTVTSLCGGDSATASVSIYVAGGPNLALGCTPFGAGHYIPLEWFLGTNELQMQNQFHNLTDYKIYRAAVSGGPYTCIGTNVNSLTSYLDTNVVVGQTNYYAVTFQFTDNSGNATIHESPFSNELKAVVPSAYDLVPPDATWTVWDVTQTNLPPALQGNLPAPFGVPAAYAANNPTQPPLVAVNTTNWNCLVWSNTLTLNLTNYTSQQISNVVYSIAMDNNYDLYVNHRQIAQYRGAGASWSAFKPLNATNNLVAGLNTIAVVISGECDQNDYFSMVVTTNTCGQ
jgi:hypothetical protein